MKNSIIFILSLGLLGSCSAQEKEGNQRDTLSYLALGDSYTIGESVPNSDNFPHLLTKFSNAGKSQFAEPEIIARTGWRTDQLLKAVNSTKLKHSTYDLVTLLIGVNDEYQGRTVQQYEEQFRLMLTRAIELAGNKSANVWVFSIPDYGHTPFGGPNQATISKRIDDYNVLNKRIAKEYKVNYLDITKISRTADKNPELIADDGLHPSKQMYQLWIEKFFEEFKP